MLSDNVLHVPCPCYSTRGSKAPLVCPTPFGACAQYHDDFAIEPRGALHIKGKGDMNAYWLDKAVDMDIALDEEQVRPVICLCVILRWEKNTPHVWSGSDNNAP